MLRLVSVAGFGAAGRRRSQFGAEEIGVGTGDCLLVRSRRLFTLDYAGSLWIALDWSGTFPTTAKKRYGVDRRV